MKIVVIDNYDSFTYNLVHYLEAFDTTVTVLKNDAFELKDLEDFDKIVLSPGPGIPSEAGLLKAVIKEYAHRKSILGVCLGLQAIGEVFGGTLINLPHVFHGVATPIHFCVENESLFKNIPVPCLVGRYHSWVVSTQNFPEELEITAQDDNGQIMALRHRKYDVKAVQFHPESILTPYGKLMIENWLNASYENNTQ